MSNTILRHLKLHSAIFADSHMTPMKLQVIPPTPLHKKGKALAPPFFVTLYFTIILTVAFLLLNVFTVMVALPFFLAVTFPVLETDATLGLLER